MTWIEDLADFVAPLVTPAVVKIAVTPDAGDDLVTLTPTGGMAPVSQHDSAIGIRRPSVQIMSRAADVPTAHARAEALYEAMSAVVNVTIGATRFLRMTPIQEPFYVGRDEHDREMVDFNCAIQRA